MKVIWSELAGIALQDTSDYIFEVFGQHQQEEFLAQIEHLVDLIAANPMMGKIEPLLAGLSHPFRSFVANHYNKIIYVIDEDVIEISDFWDTRRSPSALIARLS